MPACLRVSLMMNSATDPPGWPCITRLAARLGVERCAIEHHDAQLPRSELVNRRAVAEQRNVTVTFRTAVRGR